MRDGINIYSYPERVWAEQHIVTNTISYASKVWCALICYHKILCSKLYDAIHGDSSVQTKEYKLRSTQCIALLCGKNLHLWILLRLHFLVSRLARWWFYRFWDNVCVCWMLIYSSNSNHRNKILTILERPSLGDTGWVLFRKEFLCDYLMKSLRCR